MPSSGAPVCRLCASPGATLIGPEVSGAPESAVYRCGACSLVYLFPIMTPEQERTFYEAQFASYMAGRWQEGWQSPVDHFRAFQPEGERRTALVRDHLRASDDVLEIGSSSGYFLDDLRGYVATTTGVEPGQDHRVYAQARGIPTVGSLDDLGDRTFDVILMYYVLEHLRDPVSYLRGLVSRLRPGGRLLLEVPNVDDALLSVYGVPAFPAFYWQKAHYHYFSAATLAEVCQRAGLDAKMIPVQRYDLSNHMVWMRTGRPGGAGRYRQLFSAAVEAAYAESLKSAWCCDTVFAVATPQERT